MVDILENVFKARFSGFSKTKTELQRVPDTPDIKLDDLTTTNGSERVNDDTTL